MANIVELRDMSDEELEEMLDNAREEYFNLRFQHASARLSDVSRLRVVRREIAQIETVLHMRELAIKSAVEQPEVATAISDKDWSTEAKYSYEDSAWVVSFVDEDDDDLISTLVDLNRKSAKRRKAPRTA